MKFLKEWTLACILCASFLQSFHGVAQDNAFQRQRAEEMDGLISNTPYFPQKLLWVGTDSPSVDESKALRDALEQMWFMEPMRWEPWLEDWARSRPESPWTPSLAANLAQHYRQIGRYTVALELWEYAWELLPNYQGGDTERVRAQTLAHWSQLLSRLGRVDRLLELHEHVAEAPLDGGPFKVQFDSSGEAAHVMQTKPGRAYRCGSLALYNVAKALGLDEVEIADLIQTPSPDTGFSLQRLTELASVFGVDVIPARGRTQESIAVPSVVHWKSNHYAALVDEREGQYLVIDPTFGVKRWLRKEVVQEEASGFFLIPVSQDDQSKFERVAADEASAVFGRGYAEAFSDGCDEPECPTTESADGAPMNPDSPNADIEPNMSDNCEDCPKAPSEGGTGGSDDCEDSGEGCGSGCGFGMATWRVSEPFISLWVTDTPVFYNMSDGRVKSFTLSYKQRTDRDDDYVFGFGDLWESSLLTYVAVPSGGGGSGSSVDLWVPGGGKRAYTANCSTVEYHSRTTMCYSSGKYTVAFPRGAENVYGYSQTLGTGDKRYYLTEQTDRYGRTTTYSYSDVSGTIHLTSVTDPDGASTTFTYGSGADAHRITDINAPYSRSASFAYSSGELTSITDAENMTSSFAYDSGFLDTLTTPYGTTSFDLVTDVAIVSGNKSDNIFMRAIEATHPNGSKELWGYRNNSDETYEGSGVSLLERCPDGPDQYLVDSAVTPDFNTCDVDENDSFYWGPRQYSLLNSTFKSSGDLDDLAVTDYKYARIRNWLLEDPSYAVSNTINMERLPSHNGTDWGHTVWYDYEGKNHEWLQGTQTYPRYVAELLPSGDGIYTRYELRSDGQVTKIVEGWAADGSSAEEKKDWQYYYGANDLVQWIKGPDGAKIVEYTYNGDNQITTIKRYRDSSNYDTTTYTYDVKKRVASIDYPAGLEKEINYLNSTEWWISSIDYNESNGTLIDSESFTYSAGENRTHTDLRGLTRTFTYDKLSRIEEIDCPDATDIEIEWDKLHVSRVRDRLDEWTSYGYNNMGWMTYMTNRLDQVTSYSHCDCGALETIENPEGDEIDFSYDAAGRMTNIIHEAGPTITRTYDDVWRLISVEDGQGEVSYEYDEFQRLETVKVNSNTVTTYEYDDYDWPSKIVHDGVETRYTYDPQYRMLTRTLERGANDRVEEWTYNSSGLYSYEFDETSSQSWTTTYARDDFGRATSVTRPVSSGVSQTTSYTYNAAGDLLTLTDPASHVTTWVYDTEGRMTQKWDHSSTKIEEYDWDANGWLEDRWTIGKGTTYFTFNDEGQLTNINYPSGTTDVSYTYDDAGRLYSMSDDIGATLFRYTAAGALDYEAGPWSTDKVDYGYTHGRRTSMDVGRPGTTDWSMSYSYDSSMRLDSLTSPAGTFDYVYSGSERRVDKIDMPGSLEIDYAYTSSDKRLADSWLKYGVTTKNHHGYAYNVSGWKTEHDLPTGVTATLDHDALGQLTDADDYNTFDFDYAYDDGWNLDYRKVDGVTEQFSVNSLNELDSSPLGSATYDSNGNLTDDGNTEYTYDHADRLTQAEWQDGSDYWRESYSYDGLNRLREIYREHSTNGTTWTFSSEKRLVYDGRLVVQERDGSNNVLAHYTRGLDLSGTLSGAGGIGGILAREWSSNTAYYHSDAGGNVTRPVDSSGNVQATYQYDPYGDLLSQSGTWASVNPYLFSGKRFLGDGLYYYGYRFYNTDLQRWINKDPLGEAGGINLYGFVKNSPIDLFDSFGLSSEKIMPEAARISCEIIAGQLGIPFPEVVDARNLIKNLAKKGVKSFDDLWRKGLDSNDIDLVRNIMNQAKKAKKPKGNALYDWVGVPKDRYHDCKRKTLKRFEKDLEGVSNPDFARDPDGRIVLIGTGKGDPVVPTGMLPEEFKELINWKDYGGRRRRR